MNYLGHAFLSFQQPEILIGNMMGDYVKGKNALNNYSEGIQKGLLLHRKIDEFTDNHLACQKAKNYFRADYKLYSGAFVDCLIDHFFTDPRCFLSENDLFQFSQKTYQILDAHKHLIIEPFVKFLPFMIQQNWLYNYRTVSGMAKSFNGLAKRALHIESSQKAYNIFVQYYYEFNQIYLEFIDDVILYAKNELKLVSLL